MNLVENVLLVVGFFVTLGWLIRRLEAFANWVERRKKSH